MFVCEVLLKTEQPQTRQSSTYSMRALRLVTDGKISAGCS